MTDYPPKAKNLFLSRVHGGLQQSSTAWRCKSIRSQVEDFKVMAEDLPFPSKGQSPSALPIVNVRHAVKINP
jgi:hypothetical protein